MPFLLPIETMYKLLNDNYFISFSFEYIESKHIYIYIVNRNYIKNETLVNTVDFRSAVSCMGEVYCIDSTYSTNIHQ